MSKPVSLSLYFGVPGAGKSTFAAYLAKKDMKKGRKVWSNFGITGAMKVEKGDIGHVMIHDGRLIIDEAGLEYDNRKMSMTDAEIYFYKYHRHYQLDVDFFSQGLDVDIKIRKLARHIYLIKPSLLPFFIKRKEIGRRVGISDVTKEIIDEYFFVPLGSKYIFCPPLWKLFNTYSRKELPDKEWELW
jgi:DNA helicase HerA-like ATPase